MQRFVPCLAPSNVPQKAFGRYAFAHRPNRTHQNREVELEGLDVRGLEAFRSLRDFEFNSLAIVQRLIAISQNRGEMDENVLAALALDEAEALAGIEPLHCSLFFTHCIYSFLSTASRLSITQLSYLMLLVPSPS